MLQNQNTTQFSQEKSYPSPVDNSYSNQPYAVHSKSEQYIGVFPHNHSLKSHGKHSAFEIKPTRAKNNFITVNIEGAKPLANTSNPTIYHWENKTIIQLGKNELPELIMVLLGMKKNAKFKNHTNGNITKSLEMEFQDGGVYTKLNRYDKAQTNNCLYLTIRIPTMEAIAAGHLALVQYCQNFPTLSAEAVLKTFEYSIKNERNFTKKKATQSPETTQT